MPDQSLSDGTFVCGDDDLWSDGLAYVCDGGMHSEVDYCRCRQRLTACKHGKPVIGRVACARYGFLTQGSPRSHTSPPDVHFCCRGYCVRQYHAVVRDPRVPFASSDRDVTDQHQQGSESPVPQLILQGAEVEIVALVQLFPLEQVGNDYHVNWAPVRRGRARRSQRARQAAQRANRCSWGVGKSAVQTFAKQRRILREGTGMFVQEMKYRDRQPRETGIGCAQ